MAEEQLDEFPVEGGIVGAPKHPGAYFIVRAFGKGRGIEIPLVSLECFPVLHRRLDGGHAGPKLIPDREGEGNEAVMGTLLNMAPGAGLFEQDCQAPEEVRIGGAVSRVAVVEGFLVEV